jgi:PAS domain S-box-containing protein
MSREPEPATLSPTTSVTEGKRITGLAAIMMVAVSLSTGAAITVLYHTAFEQEKAHLIESVHDQANLMEAVARFDRAQNEGHPEKAAAETLSQIKVGFEHYPKVGQLAEITIARREGDNIVYVLRHGHSEAGRPQAIRFASSLAEPMRRAVSGRSGSMIGLDHHGMRVLAAYDFVPSLKLGVVAKIDMADIRAPFIRAATTVIGLALVLVIAGAVLFRRLTNPLVQHLTETEQRYERIFHGAPVPIWEQDFSHVWQALHDLRCSGITEMRRYLAKNPATVRRIMEKVVVKDVNAAALRQSGARSKAQFVEWVERHLIPAAPGIATEQIQAIVEGRETLLSRTILTSTHDGKELSVALSVMIPRAQHGYKSVPVSALDVTSAVHLGRREQELELILASTGEGVFGMDGEGRCTFVNRSALELLRYQDQKDLLGRDMHSQIHHTCRGGQRIAREECPVYRSRHENAAVLLEDAVLWRADGTSFPAEYRSYPMIRDRVVVGSVVTFTDITERKAREAQFVQSQKMEVVGQLTGGIAHDFNNLLTIILTNLHLLEERAEKLEDPDIREIVDDARSAASDGVVLNRRLLAFSRKQPLEPQWMDLTPFLDHTCRFLRRLTGDQIELESRRSGEPLPVRVDRQQLEAVLLNLTLNARDAMPNGGTLTIEAGRQLVGRDEAAAQDDLSPGTYVVVRVSDTGVGMSPEEVRRAVEPFYSTKPMGKGSGLGLSTALGFARQSGGSLTISSMPGRGTTVSLVLPEAEPGPADGSAGRTPEETPKPAATVLVVDDEARVRKLARRHLSSLGYQVLEAEDAVAAMRVLEGEREVDLLFTDIVMPGDMDGRALVRWARDRCPTLRILLTTGFDQEAHAVQAADETNPPLLAKPYSKDQLKEAVLAALSETQSPARAEDA